MDPLMTVLRDLEKIKQYYTTRDPACKFKHIFSNRVEDPAQRVRPPDVDVITWQQALDSIGADNPDRWACCFGRGRAGQRERTAAACMRAAGMLHCWQGHK
jgi:hypothetical protein